MRIFAFEICELIISVCEIWISIHFDRFILTARVKVNNFYVYIKDRKKERSAPLNKEQINYLNLNYDETI